MQKILDFLASPALRCFFAKNALLFEYGAQKSLQASFLACIITLFRTKSFNKFLNFSAEGQKRRVKV